MTTAVTDEVPFFNVLDPEFDFESEAVAEARERNWYATTPIGLLVLRHAEGSEIMRDRRFRLGGEHAMGNLGLTEGPFFDFWMEGMFSASAADHARLRGLLNKAFAPGTVEQLRSFARTTADRLVEGIDPGQECEFVEAFAEPLPALVMCEMLGVPPEDYHVFHRCSDDISLAFTRSIDGVLDRVNNAVDELSDYVRSLLARRRGQLGGDLISSLITAEAEGDHLTEHELHNLVVQLIWAGQDSTARQLGRTLVVFAEHPEQWTLLGERPELAPEAVEEICRWSPQARSPFRYSMEDVELHGLTIPTGTMVMVSTVAANRDPRVFDEPDRFDITAAHRQRSLTFGGGIHHCLGEAHARMEMTEGLRALTARLGPPSIAGPVTWRSSMAIIHGPEVLPLRFAPRA